MLLSNCAVFEPVAARTELRSGTCLLRMGIGLIIFRNRRAAIDAFRQSVCALGRTTVVIACLTLISVVGLAEATPSERPAGGRPLTIDDVLSFQRLDQAAISPDGQWAAFVVQRPALPGEVFGRNAYEIDPSRSDVVLISTVTGERREVTNGASRAAGFWCATWSPDGRRLAMLSTQPEGSEPRGGDNVRLYVWDRDTGRLSRQSNDGLPTQMRYGGPFERLDLRGGADHGTAAHGCSEDYEKAPYLWLDAHRLLAATLPRGQTSALLDRYTRPFRSVAADAAALRAGTEPTGRAVGSGAARLPRDQTADQAILKTFDVLDGSVASIGAVPTYPFRGALTVSVSPDGRRLALLVSMGAIQPMDGRTLPNSFDDMWTVERRLGFVEIVPGAHVRWASLPPAVARPLSLHEWSTDSRWVAVRGRADDFAEQTSLFAVPVDGGRPTQVTQPMIEKHAWGADNLLSRPAFWVGPKRLIARLPDTKAGGRSDWWLLGLDGKRTNLTLKMDEPGTFYRTARGGLVAISRRTLYRFDDRRHVMTLVARWDADTDLITPSDRGRPVERFLLSRVDGASARLRYLSVDGVSGPETDSAGGTPIDSNLPRGVVVLSRSDSKGTKVFAIRLDREGQQPLMELNAVMAQIDWGEKRLVDYVGADGKQLKAAVILPPGYQPGRRYPTLLWVYQGYQSRSLETDYFLDPMMPGIYNMYAYAAKGYVVMIPSIPLPQGEKRYSAFLQVAANVIPAADKLVALGIADPDRLAVFGQSRGGYTVLTLLTQTSRFKAGVALAGISDLSSWVGEFDPMARGYPGIEHEKSSNWSQIDQFGLPQLPGNDQDTYAKVSPLYYAEHVRTPLLMIHGDLDMRDSSTQSEQFFNALYSRGRTAELVRYGGESHSLAQSPANVRDIFSRTVRWFDVNMPH